MTRRFVIRRSSGIAFGFATRAALLLGLALAVGCGAALAAGAAVATHPAAASGGAAEPVSGASRAVCNPNPCRRGPTPGSSPHGDFTVQADNGAGSVVDRYYSVYRPSGLTNSPTNKAPAVLVFGRAASCGPSEISRLFNESQLQPVADANRFIVVYMASQTAGGRLCAWHHRAIDLPPTPSDALDDEPYVTAVIHDILVKQNVDPARIYATGASSGGAMVQAIACDPANSVLLRGIAALSEYLPVGVSSGQPVGEPRCSSTNRNLFVQIQGGTADPNVPYNGICLPSHCVSSFASTVAFWQRHLGCSAPVTTRFGSPQAVNVKTTFTRCAFGTNGVEGITVQNGLHSYAGLNDSTNGAANTDGFVPGDAMWAFFSGGLSSSGPSTPTAGAAKLSLVQVRGRGTSRVVRIRVTVGGASTIAASLRKGSYVFVARTARAARTGGTSLALRVPVKVRAGSYSLRVDVRRAAGGSTTLVRTVKLPR
jgi:polyhydroxybutyrate depolymerase